MRRIAVSLAVLALASPASALATPAPPLSPAPHVEITQQLFGLDGNPWLVANFAPDGALATPSWAVCAPGSSSCAPAGVTDQVFNRGPVPVGTAFEASAFYAGATSVARTDPWLGRVAATAPPTVTGVAKVGGHVTAHGGAWSGGWGHEFDVVHVEACRTRDGRDCTTIVHPRAFRRSPPIDPRWSGYWLFGFDERYARGTAFTLQGYGTPYGIATTPVGATVARSAPLGPVTGPRLRLREHPLLLRDQRLLLGRVTCAHGCDVTVRVSTRGADLGAGGHIHGTARLTVFARDTRLDGELSIRVRIGRTPLVQTWIPRHGVVAARAR